MINNRVDDLQNGSQEPSNIKIPEHKPIEILIEPRNEYFKILRYPLIIHRVFGLYQSITSNIYTKAYSILILVIVWYNVLKSIYTYNSINGSGADTFDAVLVLKIISTLWLILCATYASTAFMMQRDKNKIDKFIHLYNELIDYEERSEHHLKWVKIKCYIIYALAMMLCITNSIACIVAFFSTDSLYGAFAGFLSPAQNTDWVFKSTAYKLFAWVLMVYSTAAWVFPFSQFVVNCVMLYGPIDTFNDAFQRFVNTNERRNLPNTNIERLSDEEYFNELRNWYLKLSVSVRTLNLCYQEFIALSFSIFIPMSFLLLYIISDWNGNCITGLFAIVYPAWAIAALGGLFIIIVSASKITTKVRTRNIEDIIQNKRIFLQQY
jgi:hypothetical protein